MSRWAVPTVAVLLLGGALPAYAQQSARVDPLLRLLTRAEVVQALERAEPLWESLEPEARPLGGVLAIERLRPGELSVGLLARMRDEAGVTALERIGARIGARVGDIVTATLPLHAVARLEGLVELEVVEAARMLMLSHDSSRLNMRVDTVRTRDQHDFRGSSGEGVIVGIYDTGIDYRHPDFQDAQGRTRILGLWDQTIQGTPPEGYTVGAYCPPATLDDRTCTARDLNGHGTHVAGSAVGDGSAAGQGGVAFRYTGMAPGAGLLVVNGYIPGQGFPTNRIVEGVQWLSQRARELQRPVVVNLSLGGQSGPHDGTMLHELALDALARDSFVLVIAAGNEGANPNTEQPFTRALIHAAALPAPGDSALFTFRVPNVSPTSGQCVNYALFDLWYGGADNLRLRVLRPDGTSFSASTGSGQTSQTSTNGRIYFDMPSATNPNNGDRNAAMQVNDCSGAGVPQAGVWTIHVVPLSALGKPVHFWLWASNRGGQPVIGAAGFDNSHLVGSPASARTAVSVGAYTTRRCWPTQSGSTFCYVPAYREAAYGDIANFSSGGPTRDGRLKPEITAPGKGIMSALSADVTVPSALLAPGGAHWLTQGTSMAAPHVTGAIALLMQYQPSLNHEGVKSILQRTARRDALTDISYTGDGGGWPNNQWGWGRMDVRAALEDIASLATTIASIRMPARADSLPIDFQRTYTPSTFNGYGTATTGAQLTWSSTNDAVVSVNQQGQVTAHAWGQAVIRASAGVARDSIVITVLSPPSLLTVAAEALPGRSMAGHDTIPLLQLTLAVDGAEPMRIDSLLFRVTVAEPGAQLLLLHTSGSATQAVPAAPVPSGTNDVRVAPALVLQPGVHTLTVALVSAGGQPHGTEARVVYLPEGTRTTGLLTGFRDHIVQPQAPVASADIRSDILGAGEFFALSENPVRGASVTFSFSEPPAHAALYAISGRRVRDLLSGAHGLQVVWDLTNDEGQRVAPGVYLLVVRVNGQTHRQRLFVARGRDQ
jgi:subtilisin family serine protease